MEQRYIAGDWVRYIGVATPILRNNYYLCKRNEKD